MQLSSLVFPLLLVLLAVPLFLSARKQKRAAAEQQSLLSSLEPGDRVMTTSGLYGTVANTEDDATIDIEIADGVVTTWLRQAVREKVLPTDDVEEYDEDDVEEELEAPTAEEVTPDAKPVAEDAKPVESNAKK